MKKFKILISIIIFILLSFQNPNLPKKVSDKEFRYEFFTKIKKIKTKKNFTYYWFKGGKIHLSEFGSTNELLHGKYVKYYLSNQLAEQGNFKNGLRIGLWKNWFENGKLAKIENYSNGRRNGKFEDYNELGKLVRSGYYKNNKKHGTFIDFIKKDTIKYKNDSIKIKKIKLKKEKNKNILPKENTPSKAKRNIWSFFKKKNKKNDKST